MVLAHECGFHVSSSVERVDELAQVFEMPSHRTLGRCRLAQPDRPLDLAVLAQDRISVDRAADRVDQRRLQHVERPARERPQQLVSGPPPRSRGGTGRLRSGTPPRRGGCPRPAAIAARGARRHGLRRSRSAQRDPRAGPRGRRARRAARAARRCRVSSIDAIDSLTLRPIPSFCAAVDEDVRRPVPCAARIRCELRPSSAQPSHGGVGSARRRTSPRELATSVPRRSPGRSPRAGDIAPDRRDADLLTRCASLAR